MFPFGCILCTHGEMAPEYQDKNQKQKIEKIAKKYRYHFTNITNISKILLTRSEIVCIIFLKGGVKLCQKITKPKENAL